MGGGGGGELGCEVFKGSQWVGSWGVKWSGGPSGRGVEV